MVSNPGRSYITAPSRGFRATTVNPLFTVILTVCRPHVSLMLEGQAFAKTRNQFDFGCNVCDRCPRGTCDAIEPEHVAIRFAGGGYNTCKLTRDLYIFHRVFSNAVSYTHLTLPTNREV